MIEGTGVEPGCRDVASVAGDQGRVEVAVYTDWRLLTANAAWTVTVETGTGCDTRVIKCTIEEGAIDSMTLDTVTGRINVRWRCVVAAFTGGGMTASGITTTGDTRVIENTGTKWIGKRVTVAAVFCGLQVRSRCIDLADCKHAVMTSIATLAVDLRWGVAELRRTEAGGLVTDRAIFVGRNMRTNLAWRGSAIMTGGAVAGDAGVIEFGAGKGGCVMADRAVKVNALVNS